MQGVDILVALKELGIDVERRIDEATKKVDIFTKSNSEQQRTND